MQPAAAYRPNRCLDELLLSDEIYFRLAGQTQSLPGCEIAWVPDLAAVPAGCVVQCVRPTDIRSPNPWLRQVEDGVRATGARWSRIYLTQANLDSRTRALEAALAVAGYRRRVEYAFAAPPLQLGIESSVEFVPTDTDELWRLRCEIHREDLLNSDGYRADPEPWCDLMRRKTETGIKASYLVSKDGRIVGSIGEIQMSSVLRLKNIIIRPSERRKGFAKQVIRHFANRALRRRLETVGAFGIEGEPGYYLYGQAGFEIIGAQTEWAKELSA